MGERRLTYYAPCGISVCRELDVEGIVGGSSALRPHPKHRSLRPHALRMTHLPCSIVHLSFEDDIELT